MKKMNMNEVRVKLGLKPWDEHKYNIMSNLKNQRYLYNNKQDAINEMYRQIGRTTKIICEMLSDATLGLKVVFIADNLIQSRRINKRIMEYAKIIGIRGG